MIKVIFSLGTRPSIIKMATVILESRRRRNIESLLVNTGQHYDWEMSKAFFDELKLPRPDYNLHVRSGSHGVQTAKVIVRFEEVLIQEKPDFVVVDGDTNSSMACAITACKLRIPVGHVEAGCRSFDKSMIEEINRVIISDLASLHFAPTENCVNNLLNEGVKRESIFLTGHPLVDLLRQVSKEIATPKLMNDHSLSPKQFYVLTLHRDFNTDNKDRLKEIIKAITEIARKRPVIFPIHPRTRKNISRFGLDTFISNIITSKPVGYLEMLGLIKNARAVLTDSGGIQQETTILGTPCITLRENTEWIETLTMPTNQLAGASFQRITMAVRDLERKYYSLGFQHLRVNKNVFGKPGASSRILDIICNTER